MPYPARMRPSLIALAALPLLACPRQPGELPDNWAFTAAPECASPAEGLDRFSEEAAERGLDRDVAAMRFGPAFALAHDLDGDGDVDVIIKDGDQGILKIHLNDGTGHFTDGPLLQLPIAWPVDGAVVAGDADGDGLADLFVVPATDVWFLKNLGGGSFATGELVWSDPQDAAYRHLSLALGDADGDGDLDLLLPSHEPWNAGPPPDDPGPNPQFEGQPDRVLLLDDGAYGGDIVLDNGTRSLVLAGTFTDFDGDGDQDILVPSDRALPLALWRNDGGAFTDVAPELGAAFAMDGMGIDAADLNGDGRLDYCITDSGPMKCLLSDGGSFVESTQVLGLSPPARDANPATIGWTIEIADLDNDGHLDAFQTSGTMFDGVNMPAEGWADLLWQGSDSGGFERLDGVGPSELRGATHPDDYGAAAADFDRDGWLDLLISPDIGPPQLWMNRCGEGRFLSVELSNIGSNTEGYGTRVEVQVGEQSTVRELHSLRGQGQGPSRLHFGLGDATLVDRVRVTWPDGTVEEAEDVEAGGWLVVARR